MENQPDQIQCPKCGSTQITANKKGFSGGKAVAGAVLTGGIGLLAGTIGSKKIIITCLNCGNEFKPGDRAKSTTVAYQTLPRSSAKPSQIKAAKILGIIFSVISVPLTILMFGIGEKAFGAFFLVPTLLFLFMAFRKVPTS